MKFYKLTIGKKIEFYNSVDMTMTESMMLAYQRSKGNVAEITRDEYEESK